MTSINEPATAYKEDGRGCLNKRPPSHTGPAASVECIGLPWNVSVTLITPRPSVSLMVTQIARRRTTRRLSRVVRNIESFEREL